MRRLLFVLLAAVAIAGCGSSSGGRSPASPLAGELSYFDSGSPFVLTLATSPSAAAVRQGNALLGRFPLAGFGEQALLARLRQVGIDYAADVRPLLGKPLVFGIDARELTGAAAQDFLLALQTASATKLSALIHKVPGMQSHGRLDGARLFSLGTLQIAQAGATVLFAGLPGELRAALARHAHGGGLSAGAFDRLTAGLPSAPLLEAVGDLRPVLSRPSASKARQVPWVAAIRGYGVALDATSSGLRLDYRLDTAGATLSGLQLPISASAAAPPLAGQQPITVGLSGPGQSVSFLVDVLKVADPSALRRYPKGVSALSDLAGDLRGDVAVSSDGRTTLGRLPVSDAARARSDLRALFANSRAAPRPIGGGFYARGGITVGVSGNELLVGRASLSQLKAFATAASAPEPGTQGSLAFRVGLPALLRAVLHRVPSGVEATLLSQLGAVTGWAKATAAALSGVATLTLR